MRLQRLNADGTVPTATRFIGASGSLDLSSVLTDGTHAPLTVQIDDGAPVVEEMYLLEDIPTVTVKLSAVTEWTATLDAWREVSAVLHSAVGQQGISTWPATVQEIADQLNTQFSIIQWSVENGRLKGNAGSGTYVQVSGALAAALGLGMGDTVGGNGLEILSYLDDEVVSFGLAKKVDARTMAVSSGALGRNITRMITDARVYGLSPVLRMGVIDQELIELVNGGSLDRTTHIYDPPTSDDEDSPQFWMEIFVPLFSRNLSRPQDVSSYQKLLFRKCQGHEGDQAIQPKSFGIFEIAFDVDEGHDQNGVKVAAYQEQILTADEYEALHVADF